ncbi:KilA-N domain-containing protein [Burkholderia sp. Ap-962]|uniref:KilA-N domain-containing protein n=1 Tax=Burkholderia sp. Ap-962 TaxID=2608333 RepID=UPI001423C6C3|nr:KilA-N domain-containing protein [Burkholderia sp. Ap-962]NIF70206.1 KilA-N domain-containing protein [Burkholderia sp. Ap-962]
MQHIVHATFEGFDAKFTRDGWFDATTAAQQHGKRISHWLENEETQQYIKALAAALNVRDSGDLIRTQRGRAGGTWLHPKLAVVFARWCSPRFAVWCDLQIDALIRDGYARISDAERTHWRQMLELEKRDESSKVRASFGSHLMLQRKREKPSIEKERERLATALQPSFKFH